MIGQTNGTVPGVVRSFFNPQSAALLGNLQKSHTINRTNCTTLKYAVFSTRNSETLTLLPEKTNIVGFQYETANVFISFLECPPAFILSNTSVRGDCVPKLAQYHAECYIDNQTILCPLTTWIGYHNSTGNTVTQSGVLFNQHCPFNHCESDWSLITINRYCKKRYCNILEFSFYLNLGAVSVATLYVNANDGTGLL